MSAIGNFAAFGNFGLSNSDRTAQLLGVPQVTQDRAFISSPEGNELRDQSSAEPSAPQSSADFESSEDEKFNPDFGAHNELFPVRSAAEQYEAKQQRHRDTEVLKLARKVTSRSSISKGDYEKNDPLEPEEGSILDPRSPYFKPRAWTKSLLQLQSRDPEKYKQRTAGFAFKNLNVFGFGASTDYQKTVGNVALQVVGLARKVLGLGQRRIDILRDFEGVVHAGEMLVVLGPPGSGCSTFLKTVSGETHGFYIDDESYINYQGISAKHMHKNFRGEAIYTAEVDVHFPMLNVFQTLSFAAEARAPRHVPGNMKRKAYGELLANVIMAQFGIGHTRDTRVGNDFVRGVSGGERKRVSIAEAALSAAPLQCWDNSTRGLDSANAIEFCKTVRTSTDLSGTTACVSIYQSPQSAFDVFDKALVIYEGRQIFFGPCGHARDYFVNMGFYCPDRQTTADFLTSMTSPQERLVREGFEAKVPKTPDEFAAVWKASPERAALLKEIDEFDKQYEVGGEYLERFKESRRIQQAKHQRVNSPYTLAYSQQVLLCLRRGFWRLKGDPSLTFTQLFGNFIMALVIGSVFYNLPLTTQSFFSRGALLFFAVLLNAFGSALEILTLYAQRSIVEKHSRYALYHPSTEALASMLTDMPYKIANAIVFNLTLYFMTNLNRTPGAFFFFLLITFTLTLTMSMLFRFIASVSRTLSQAMAPAAILILGIVIYTGFTIPTRYMLGWSRWINYIDPVAYGFESLMINEFYGRQYECSALIPSGPGYQNTGRFNQVCSAVGAEAGQTIVSGTRYLEENFQYERSHKWRNFGIMLVFMVGLMALYVLATEYITEKKSKGEVLLFKRGHTPASLKEKQANDEEAANGNPVGAQMHKDESAVIQRQTAIFHWQDVCYDIKIKGETKRILDHVDGWVKPGTLTALMGESGAGKTTLLDVLATRTTMGVIDGQMLVDGRLRDDSFQRKTGYVQQQDLHLATSTVREALNFSALLRQPARVPREEKLAYVDEVIKLLDMQEYADAVVGVPGEGLNVEQRKRLTIGVELAAKPELLLFLDEPTSGLDSQTSWAILDLLEKLTKNGQAVLCTIHQPSAMLFQRFDRLLLLQKGGQTVYYGEIGENSKTLTNYFESNGAHPCPPDANPAEWFLEVIGAAPGSHTEIDWFKTWRESAECQAVHDHLEELKRERPKVTNPAATSDDKASYREFAAHFWVQAYYTTIRVFEQYWRTPSYIYSKTSLCLVAALFIGFSFFNADRTQQGLQNQLFSVFLLFTIFGQLAQQIMPHFVTQRSLYEARERPSKTYSWKAFMLSNIIVEIPWNTLMAVIIFVCWYYPIGLYKNAEPTDTVNERSALMFLLIWTFLLFTCTFTAMVVAGVDTAETAGNIANLLFSLTLIFCGVLATPEVLPGFWIFMYRVSPFTYLVEGMLTTGLANTNVYCDSTEFLHFTPPSGDTCGEYMNAWISAAGGYLQDKNATDRCSFCPIDSTNTFLVQTDLQYENRWRDFGIMWAFIIFNIFGAIGFYWLARVPKRKRKEKLE